MPLKREEDLSVGQQLTRTNSTESEDDGATKVSNYGFPVFAIDNQDQQGIADQSLGTFEVQGQWSQDTNISSFLVLVYSLFFNFYLCSQIFRGHLG